MQSSRLYISFTYVQSPLQFAISLILLHALLIQFSNTAHVVITCFLLLLCLICLQLFHPCSSLCITLFLLCFTSVLFRTNSGLTLFLLLTQHRLILCLLLLQSRFTLFCIDASFFSPFRLFLLQFSHHCSEIRLILCIFLRRQFLHMLRICSVHEQ